MNKLKIDLSFGETAHIETAGVYLDIEFRDRFGLSSATMTEEQALHLGNVLVAWATNGILE